MTNIKNTIDEEIKASNIIEPSFAKYKLEDQIEREGTIDIIPLNEKKFENFTFTTYTDPKTGYLYGYPIGKDKEGNYRYKRLRLTGHRTFNLSVTSEAIEAFLWKNHPYRLGSPLQKGKPLFKLYDRVIEAKESISKIKLSKNALEIAESLIGESLFDFARVLGISPEANDPIVVQQLVLEKANREPNQFIESYNDSNRAVMEVFHRCASIGTVKFVTDSGWVYKEQYQLGSTHAGVASYLQKHTKLLQTMHIESKRLSTVHTEVDLEELNPSLEEKVEEPIVETTEESVVETTTESTVGTTNETALEEVTAEKEINDTEAEKTVESIA